MTPLPFDIKPTKQAVIFIGIQASGKSTFYNKMLADYGYVHINLDTLHTRHKESQKIMECLTHNKSFVVDNTNPQSSDRERYITEAKKHGYEVVGIYFQSILKCCIERNEARGTNIPGHAIANTQKKMEMPQYDEGFDKLYFVKIIENGFEIKKWK